MKINMHTLEICNLFLALLFNKLWELINFLRKLSVSWKNSYFIIYFVEW